MANREDALSVLNYRPDRDERDRPKRTRRTILVAVRLTPEEKGELQEWAHADRVGLSTLIRRVLKIGLYAARKRGAR